jgi:spermidine synthase
MKFAETLKFIKDINIEGDLLEIGSDRGDGSTYIFATLAKNLGRQLFSVDVDSDVIEKNREEFKQLPFDLPVDFFNQTGEQFLEDHNNLRFSIVLLDNFDWDWNPHNSESHVLEQQKKYRERFGLEMNNHQSQFTHLRQALMLTHMLTDEAIVICDDTYWAHEYGTYTGKCGAVIPYLETLGFNVVLNKDHGIVMLRKNNQ